MGRRRAEKGASGSASTPANRPHVDPQAAHSVASQSKAAASATAESPSADAEVMGRHFKPGHRRPLWLRITALVMSAALVLVVGTAGILFFRLQNNVTTSPLTAGVGNKSSDQAAAEDTGSLQILILGTDTRDGANSEYGTEEDSAGEGKSDVMLLLNISADNSQVSVTSFPRDLMVPIPDCTPANGGEVVAGAAAGMLNGALTAGPGCTVSAINDLTGLSIDHFMLADFTAVKELSSALGGVEVCVDQSMYDYDGSFLRLPAGKSLIEGEQALAFLRTRHSFGDSSDLARIEAQQYFLASMVRKVKSEGTLTNLPRLYTLADVVTKNLTIDEDLANIPAMVSVATRLAKIDLANVAFVTVPTEAYVGDSNRVQLKEPEAGQYFAALRKDTSLTAKATTTATTAAPSSDGAGNATSTATESTPEASTAPTSAAVYDKSLQAISVTDATAIVGRASELLQTLAGAGFSNSWSAGETAAQNDTQLLYGTDMADVAADVAALFNLPDSAVKEDPTVAGISLIVGTDWTSGTSYGTVTLPADIVASTADNANQCLVVNPGYYDTGVE